MRLKSLAIAALALAAIPTAAHAAGFDVEQATRAYLDTLPLTRCKDLRARRAMPISKGATG